MPSPMFWEAMPVELDPFYRTNQVNEAVCLYSGPLDLIDDDQVASGNGSIQLVWLPVPQIRFQMDVPNWSPKLGPLRLPSGVLKMIDGRSVDVHVTGINLSGGENSTVPTFEGIGEAVKFVCGDPIVRVTFHVPNFPSFVGSSIRDESGRQRRLARAVMEGDGWRVTLDGLPRDGDMREESFGSQIKRAGGFGITHVGRIERSDGSEFSATDAGQLDEALSWFLSFCRGSWVGPVLAVGFDVDGKRVWEEWRLRKIERWRCVGSWFDSLSCVGLVEAFPGFSRRWKDETWNEPIRLALHWYVESNMCSGGVEGGTILTQAAFELLAWTLLVEDQESLSEAEFKKLPASDQLRLLLSSCGIPPTIPTSMCALTQAAAAYNWKDGPQAITGVRNALVHASPKNRKRVLGADTGVRYEAWWLGLWYLELVLLRLFDFQGKYSDRLVQEGLTGQEVKFVPWATTA